ncbi:bacillithiol biosynthesis cysteine-adding enzyme BshC [Paenibacillus selenitireducens]|uniref:Putative cysteine ligase BshC n=1 Tax=Paenibacillus selenitireducens TaxID=1324314 RepID=A0A1T2XEY7_9BACL|nr:bacillithiol biosynthesis cysteine-adding enzyme BshC [Paenibacillus selenitireducens]OPA78454.1 bacillithiol biosynthesis cysteine-adding enzyme BshC [Paenibacillus selenitireducens]
MNVVQEPMAVSQPLSDIYMRDYNKVKELYDYNPQTEEAWHERAAWLDQTHALRADRKALVSRLRSYNAERNPHEAVARSLDDLEDVNTLVVVGGQQSGLFTGPLLVIYKALTIIQTARMAEKRLNRKVVPVFWIAGEDHDFDEVNHTYVLSSDLQVQKIKIDHPTGERSMVSQVQVPMDAWQQAIEELSAKLPNTEFKEDFFAKLQSYAEVSCNLSDYYARIFGMLFGEAGLVLLDSADSALRSIEVPMFERIIEDNDPLEEALMQSLQDVQDHQYNSQADVTAGNANLFYIHEGTRLLLHKVDGRFTDRKQQVSFSRDELQRLVQEHPERFSNNVLTRPLMQDYLFPVLSTVLGTGEIAYWALTHRAFHAFGFRMPIIVPRMSFTFVEGTVQKQMTKYELSFADVVERFTVRKEAWLQAQDTLGLDVHFEDMKQQLNELYEPILEKLAQIQAGLGKLGETNKQKVLEQVEFLQHRAANDLAKQNETALRHWERIHSSILPLGKPQERVYNIFAYLNRYGLAWISSLYEIPLDLSGQHRVISLPQ